LASHSQAASQPKCTDSLIFYSRLTFFRETCAIFISNIVIALLIGYIIYAGVREWALDVDELYRGQFHVIGGRATDNKVESGKW
jgi:hypothetical protein